MLVALDQEIAAVETAVVKANDVIKTLNVPIQSATDAVKAVIAHAAAMSVTDARSMLEARRTELAERMAKQNEGVLDELAQIEQRRNNLLENPQGPTLVNLFLAGGR